MPRSPPRRIHARIVAAAAFVVGATLALAQETKSYDQDDPEALMKDEIVPLAERLTPLLRQVVRGRDGRAMPIQLLSAPIVPTDPEGPFRVHFYCPWGAANCAQFLRACVSLQLSCSCSDFGSIDPDPCYCGNTPCSAVATGDRGPAATPLLGS